MTVRTEGLAARRILVVEDDVQLAGLYAQILKELPNVAVDVAGSESEALDKVGRVTYHLVLVDVMLAGSTDRGDQGGLSVLRRLRELGEGTAVITSTRTK